MCICEQNAKSMHLKKLAHSGYNMYSMHRHEHTYIHTYMYIYIYTCKYNLSRNSLVIHHSFPGDVAIGNCHHEDFTALVRRVHNKRFADLILHSTHSRTLIGYVITGSWVPTCKKAAKENRERKRKRERERERERERIWTGVKVEKIQWKKGDGFMQQVYRHQGMLLQGGILLTWMAELQGQCQRWVQQSSQ